MNVTETAALLRSRDRVLLLTHVNVYLGLLRYSSSTCK